MITEAEVAPEKQTARYEQVKDGRGRPIQALYRRNDKFYIQVYLPGKGCRRFVLTDENDVPVTNATAAQEAMVTFRKNKREGVLPVSKHAPFFKDYYDTDYCKWLEETKAKSQLTVDKERGALKQWAEAIGSLRLTDISVSDVRDYMLARSKAGKNPRTVNLDVIALGNCLRFAREEGRIHRVVTEGVKALKYTAKKRELFAFESLNKLVAEALRMEEGKPVYLYGRILADWLLFIGYTGARRQAALTAKWSCIDWTNKQVTLHTKFDKKVVVDFNPKLEAHLLDMKSRRNNEDVDWMFPSYYEDGPGHLTNMEKTLTKVRDTAGFPKFHPHLLRHAFISYAVMQGVPAMTIATWVGHSDGGVLIGKVYGHLNPAHKREQANKLVLTDSAAPAVPQIDLSKLSAQQLLELLQKAVGQQAVAAALPSQPAKAAA